MGDIPDFDNALDDRLKNISLTYRFDALQEEKKRYHQGQLKIIAGSFLSGAEVGQDEEYKIYSANYSLLDFWRLPFFNADTRLVYRAEAQYAGINLSGIMRFSLSGPTRARAYSSGIFTADDAVYLGFDWIFNSPGFFNLNITKSINLKEFAKPFLFFDYAYGKQQPLAESETNAKASLMDTGFGFKLSQGKSFSGNLLLAFPLKEKFVGISSLPVIDSQRVVFDFQYSF